MNRESCQRYLEDPDANASHLTECAECRALADSLLSSIPSARSSVVPDLPIAQWEGAAHRSWPLVVAGAIAVGVMAALLLAANATSPLDLFRGKLPTADILASLARLRFIQNAPPSWQIFIGVSFVIVNGIFIALLRRAPRGLDV